MPEQRTKTLAVSTALLITVVAIAICEVLIQTVQDPLGRYLGGFLLIVSTLFASGLILRKAPSMFSAALTVDQWLEGSRPTAALRLRHCAQWFIVMRWIAVIVTLTLTVLIIRVGQLLEAQTYGPLLVTAVVLAALNIVYSYLIHIERYNSFLLQMQVVGDLLILTVLLHFSGGIENPLAIVMALHVIIAGILLRRAECYAVAGIASVLFAVMVLLELFGTIDHYTLLAFPHEHGDGGLVHAAHDPLYIFVRFGLHTFILFLLAVFVTTLAARQRFDEMQLINIADEAIVEGHLLRQSLETTSTAVRVVDQHLNSCFSNRHWNLWFEQPDVTNSFQQQLNGEQSDVRRTLEDGQTRSLLLSQYSDQDGQLHALTSEKNASSRVYRMTTAALPAIGESKRQVVQIVQDITELKEAEARLIRAGQLAAVGELASHVAHEVNNPIAIISAKARLMLTDDTTALAPVTATELEKIVDLSDRVARIAQGLLAYSRPSDSSRTPLDLTQAMQHAVWALAERAAGADVVIKEDRRGPLPVIHGNSQELEQVFLNILMNAIDAMPTGGQLTVTAAAKDGPAGRSIQTGMAIVIQDTGCGISPEACKQVFRPFFTTKEKGAGTGLGLSICDDIIRSHGGMIEISSTVGQGTTVTIWLPADTT